MDDGVSNSDDVMGTHEAGCEQVAITKMREYLDDDLEREDVEYHDGGRGDGNIGPRDPMGLCVPASVLISRSHSPSMSSPPSSTKVLPRSLSRPVLFTFTAI